MRGGSSLLGHLFSDNPDAFYWYESLAALYSSLAVMSPFNFATMITHNTNNEPRFVSVVFDWLKGRMCAYDAYEMYYPTLPTYTRPPLTHTIPTYHPHPDPYPVSIGGANLMGGTDSQCYISNILLVK